MHTIKAFIYLIPNVLLFVLSLEVDDQFWKGSIFTFILIFVINPVLESNLFF